MPPTFNQSQIDGLRFYAGPGIKVAKASTAYTSTIAQTLFTITGGKVLVNLFMATVTLIHQVTTLNIKTQTAPTTGTAVALSTDVDTTGLEAGGTLYVEGDGTATVKANGGVVLSSATQSGFVVTTGAISFTPSATATGATLWELWYIPIDDNALVVAA
jgi:hypothetical protein